VQTRFYIPISGVRCVEEGDNINVHYWPIFGPKLLIASVRYWDLVKIYRGDYQSQYYIHTVPTFFGMKIQ